jgi:hypothetical protein
MAVVNGKTNHRQHSVLQSTWVLGDADSGTLEQLSRYPNKSIQIGTTGDVFGGATVLVEGSDDGVTFTTIKDIQGNSVSTLTATRYDVTDIPYHIRPRSSGGSGTSVTVIITSRSFGA